jgi:hypothetical protein
LFQLLRALLSSCVGKIKIKEEEELLDILLQFPAALVHLEILPVHLLAPFEILTSSIIVKLFELLNSKSFAPLASEILIKLAPILANQHLPQLEQLLISTKKQDKMTGIKIIQKLHALELTVHHTTFIMNILLTEVTQKKKVSFFFFLTMF